MFINYFRLAVDTVACLTHAVDFNQAPVVPDATPTFRVYNPAGENITASNGTCTAHDAGNLTGSYRVAFTTSSPDYVRGQSYTIVVIFVVDGNEQRRIYTFKLT